MPQFNNTVQFLVYGDKALFTDPVTKIGGERHTYPIPTYEALRGIMDNIYWKPTIRWHINRVRIMNPIQKESLSVRQIKYNSSAIDRCYNTYLTDVAYQVEASFSWSNPGPGFEGDRNPIKHLEIAKRAIRSGGRFDVFLGSRECPAYVEPCVFGEGEGAYDFQPKTDFGLMFHGYNYPEMTGRNALEARLWHATMEHGFITFPRPEDCPVTRYVRDMRPKTFSPKHVPDHPLPESAPQIPDYPAAPKGNCRRAVCEEFVPWEVKLCETYDNLLAAGPDQNGSSSILPICHIRKDAQIQFDVDQDGYFIFGSGVVLPQDEADTLLPCSTQSQFRTSAKIPHLLFDCLEYMASDYAKYSGKPGSEATNEAYIEQLRRWANEPDTPESVKAIYTYLSRNALISDLITEGIIPVTENAEGEKTIPVKWPGTEDAPEIYRVCDPQKGPLSCFIRIRFMSHGTVTDPWTDPVVQQSAISFNDKLSCESGDLDICYVSGKKGFVTTLHPYVRGTTKLISSNDTTGFTYRAGLLDRPEHRVKIGYEASQKIHLALRWLLANQSFTVGSQTYLLWSTHNRPLPSIFKDKVSQPASEEDVSPDVTLQEYFKQVKSYIRGFETDLEPHDEAVLMSIASSSPGRLSITNYQPLQTSSLLYNIRHWHETCYARLPLKDVGMVIRAPYIYEIVRIAVGSNNSAVSKEQAEKALYPCIILGQPLPRNLIDNIFRNIVRAMTHPAPESIPFHSADFNVAAAVIRKSLTDRGVDLTQEDRSTKFGRILAYCYEIERFCFYLSKNNHRTTNAETLIRPYCQLPARTLDILSRRLLPYRSKIQRTDYGKTLLSRFDALVNSVSNDEMNNQSLNERFILGYHAQLAEFYNRISQTDS